MRRNRPIINNLDKLTDMMSGVSCESAADLSVFKNGLLQVLVYLKEMNCTLD